MDWFNSASLDWFMLSISDWFDTTSVAGGTSETFLSLILGHAYA